MKIIDGHKRENIHFEWNNNLKPVEFMENNEMFKIKIPDSSTDQIKEDYNDNDIKNIDTKMLDAAVGPFYINNAEPGDTLKITINDINTGKFGWSQTLHNFGLLSEDFSDELIIWDINNNKIKSRRKNFLENITFDAKPFLGIIGTAPLSGKFPMIPPQSFGGNMDNKHLKKGSILYLPVNVKGALISFADPHALQGDGEVTGTAVETSCEAEIKIEVIKNLKINYPEIISYENENINGKYINTMGIGNDIYNAAKIATKEMIKALKLKGFRDDEAYVLCSITGNLKISEIVDVPNFVVTMSMPDISK